MGKNRYNFPFLKIEFQATDAFLIVVLFLYTLLIILFNFRVKGWVSLAITNLVIVAIYSTSVYFQIKISSPIWKFLLRMFSVSFLLIYIFDLSVRLSLILFDNWNDQVIIDLEQHVFGVQPTIWIQKWISPLLTEWFMLCFLFYLPLYPILGAFLYFKCGENQMEDFLFTVSINNVICNIGYFLYPVANPLTYLDSHYSVPLQGYIFTSIQDLMRTELLSSGGAMPSGHAAASTIILLMSYRYYRPLFYFLIPIVTSIYISLVYGRFHYLSDVIVGILIALLCWWTIPYLKKKLGLDE